MSEPQSSRTSGLIDSHVGARIRERRVMLGLSQLQVAQMIGVTYQQVTKYEHGANRISAGRLYEIAHALDTPITYFYEGVDDVMPPPLPPRQRMILEVARNFAAIENERHREVLCHVARVLAGRVSARQVMATSAITITRQEARKRDLNQYMTGKPCKHGHVAERRTDTGNCVECQRVAQQKYKAGSGGSPQSREPNTMRRRLSITAARTDAGTSGVLG